VTWVNLAQDFWAARELRRHGMLSFRSWCATLKGPKVHAVFAWDDLVPSLGYASEFLITLFKSRLTRR
jgi:hypothetical protein